MIKLKNKIINFFLPVSIRELILENERLKNQLQSKALILPKSVILEIINKLGDPNQAALENINGELRNITKMHSDHIGEYFIYSKLAENKEGKRCVIFEITKYNVRLDVKLERKTFKFNVNGIQCDCDSYVWDLRDLFEMLSDSGFDLIHSYLISVGKVSKELF